MLELRPCSDPPFAAARRRAPASAARFGERAVGPRRPPGRERVPYIYPRLQPISGRERARAARRFAWRGRLGRGFAVVPRLKVMRVQVGWLKTTNPDFEAPVASRPGRALTAIAAGGGRKTLSKAAS